MLHIFMAVVPQTYQNGSSTVGQNLLMGVSSTYVRIASFTSKECYPLGQWGRYMLPCLNDKLKTKWSKAVVVVQSFAKLNFCLKKVLWAPNWLWLGSWLLTCSSVKIGHKPCTLRECRKISVHYFDTEIARPDGALVVSGDQLLKG